MKKLILIYLILTSTFLFGQNPDDQCSHTSWEDAVHLCGDERYYPCECPLAQTSPTITRHYTFDILDTGNSVVLSLGPVAPAEIPLLEVRMIGPLDFNSNYLDTVYASGAPEDQINFNSTYDIPYAQHLSGAGVIINFPDVPGRYFVTIEGSYSYYQDTSVCASVGINFIEDAICKLDTTLPCETCIGSFAPIQGEKYLVSAWAKESGALPTTTTYTKPELSIVCDTGSGTATFGPFNPSGQIIDGWQRIEEEFTIPTNATNIQVLLESTSGDVYFDDVRFFPFNASMKSYVYDPINMRLSAELDERHFATFYEYDEEGKLKRIKKETEKGVMTIQETKSNSAK